MMMRLFSNLKRPKITGKIVHLTRRLFFRFEDLKTLFFFAVLEATISYQPAIDCLKGGRKMPRSVIIALIKSAGVTSNAGLKTLQFSGAICLP